MENQITLNVPTSSRKNQVEFKTYKLYVEGEDSVNPNGIWLANISFTKETEEAGIELLNGLQNVGALKSYISSDETIDRIAPKASDIKSIFAKLAK